MTTADWTPPEDLLERASAGLGELRLRRLAELAVERGIMTEAQLQEALRLHPELPPGQEPGELLVAGGWIPADRLPELIGEMGRRIPTLFEMHGLPEGVVPSAAAAGGASMTRYELLEKLGEGGMGIVHRARDRQLDRIVALKILKDSAAASPVARNRFQQEAQAAARLSHPNIVSVFDVGEEADRMFFVMELVDGQPLHHLMNDPKTDLRLLVRLVERIARGIQHAHDNDIVHRDIKPANVLVARNGEPKVVDFGVAHIMGSGSGLTKTGSTIGTPFYMAPEQVHGRVAEITGRTDIYALGVMLYEMTARRPPFEAESVAELYSRIVNDEPVAPRRLRPSIPVDLETITMKALDKSPARRYATARELADDLQRWLDGEPILARPISLPARLLRRALKQRAVLALGSVILLLVAALAGLWIAGHRNRVDREAVDRLVERARTPLEEARSFLYMRTAPWSHLTGRAEEAQKLLLEAIGRDPLRVPAHHLLGRSWFILGRDDMAERSWRRAIELDPKFAPAHLDLGRLLHYRSLYETLGNSQEDIDRRRPVAENLARESVAETRKAIELQGRGESTLDREIAETLVLFAARKAKEVQAKVTDASGRFGDQPGMEDLCLLMALVMPSEKEHSWLDRAIDIRPKFPAALLFRALAWREAANHEEAIKDYSAAIEVDPNRTLNYLCRAASWAALGDYPKAKDDYTKAIALDDSEASAWGSRAVVRSLMRDHEGAVADATKAIERDPGRARFWVTRAAARATLDDVKGAMQDFDHAISLDAKDPEAPLGRAQLKSRIKDYAGAESDATIALSLAPQTVEAFITRGLARNNLGRGGEGIVDLKHARDLLPEGHPRLPSVLTYIGNIQADLDKKRKPRDF